MASATYFYWLFLSVGWGLLLWELIRPGPRSPQLSSVRRDRFPLLFALAIVAARWPTILIGSELNPDESWLFAGALRLMHDPIPWRGADNTTSGPLSSYLLIPLIRAGLDTGYAAARITSIALLCAAVIFWYLTLRSLRGALVAGSLLLPAVAWLCFVAAADPMGNQDFTHYSTELLPVTLLSACVWLVTRFTRTPDAAPFMAGFLVGAVPFAKLQAAPLAVAIFLAMAAGILASRIGQRRSLLALVAGGTVPALAIALALTLTGTLDDAWRSYIVSGWSIATQTLSLRKFAAFVLGFPPLNVAFGALAIITLANFSASDFVGRTLVKERLLLLGALLYGMLALVAVWKPGNPWGHYLLLLLHPTLLLAALLSAPTGTPTPWQRFLHFLETTARKSPRLSQAGGLGGACLLALLIATLLGPPTALRIARSQSPDPLVEVLKSLARPDDHFAVWGYMPHYYAMTGKMPSTREAITQFQVWDGPQREYYRQRYLGDLRRRPPDVFVDASGEGNFSFKFHPRMPIEQFPDLARFVQGNFVLLLDLGRCATPRTRIFVSRERLHELGLRDDAVRAMPSCIRDERDVDLALRLLKSKAGAQ